MSQAPKRVEKKINQAVKEIKTVQKDFRGKFGPNRFKPRRNKNRRQPITKIGRDMRRIGSGIGGFFGFPNLGRSVGAGISRITGNGDYITNAPRVNSLMSGGPPSFSPLSSGFRVKHREYIRDITSSIAFASATFNINPGLELLFPWLSSIAINFEEYKIHGMIVYLNSTSGTAVSSTNTALGLWGAVTQYDPTEPSFTNKQQCENYVGCQTTVPFNSIMHGIECKPNVNVLNKYFVRSGAIADNEDLKFYDIGKLQVFTQGSQAAATIGEMWISYDIEFMKPRLPTGGVANVLSDRYVGLGVSNNATYFGPGISTATSGSNLGTILTGTSNQLILPGNVPNTKYLVVVEWSNAVTWLANSLTVSLTTPGLTFSPWWTSSTGVPLNYIQAPSISAASTYYITTFVVNKDSNTDVTISFTGMTNMPSGSNYNIIVTQINNGLGLNKIIPNRLDMDEIESLRLLLGKIKELKKYKYIQEQVDEKLIQDVLYKDKRIDEISEQESEISSNDLQSDTIVT